MLSHPYGTFLEYGILQPGLQVVDHVLPLHHDGPAPLPGHIEEPSVRVEGYGSPDHLQEPHVRYGIPHPNGAFEARLGAIQELFHHPPLVPEGVLQYLPGVASPGILGEYRAPGTTETQRLQEEVQDLLRRTRDGYELVPGPLEPQGYITRVDVHPPAVGLHLRPGTPLQLRHGDALELPQEQVHDKPVVGVVGAPAFHPGIVVLAQLLAHSLGEDPLLYQPAGQRRQQPPPEQCAVHVEDGQRPLGRSSTLWHGANYATDDPFLGF